MNFKSEIEKTGCDIQLYVFWKNWRNDEAFCGKLWAMGLILQTIAPRASEEIVFLVDMIRGELR